MASPADKSDVHVVGGTPDGHAEVSVVHTLTNHKSQTVTKSTTPSDSSSASSDISPLPVKQMYLTDAVHATAVHDSTSHNLTSAGPTDAHDHAVLILEVVSS